MPDTKNNNIIEDPDLFSVYLVNPPYRGVRSFYDLTVDHYDNVLGPIPVAEMNCRMPRCFFRIKTWCECMNRITRDGGRCNGRFVKGDLIVMQKGPLTVGGFYTDEHPMGIFESELYPMLKYKTNDIFGFMYTDGSYLNQTLIEDVKHRHARENIRS